MTPFIFLTPIIFAVILFIFFKKLVVWWEYLVLIIPSLLITTMVYYGMISSSTSDVEYIGDYVTEIRYYEEWDEWISQTCTETHTDADGNSYTTTYDCSYVDYHDEYYVQITSSGDENRISKKEFDRLSRLWNNSFIFVDMKRDYHRNDGDMYKKFFDGKIESSKTVTKEHIYKNKIINSYSIFGFSKISKEEAIKIGLYDYPKLFSNNDGGGFFTNGSFDQSPFLGYTPTKHELKIWKYINGYFGPKNQIRIFILYFYNKPRSIVQEQRSYWFGGNKNELVYCFGIDSTTNKIQWVDSFSWSDKPTMEVNLQGFYIDKDTLNLYELAVWTKCSIPTMWKRKEFKDFEYIKIELSNNQLLWLFIIVIIINLVLSLFIILNNIVYDDDGRIISD